MSTKRKRTDDSTFEKKVSRLETKTRTPENVDELLYTVLMYNPYVVSSLTEQVFDYETKKPDEKLLRPQSSKIEVDELSLSNKQFQYKKDIPKSTSIREKDIPVKEPSIIQLMRNMHIKYNN